MYAHDVLARKFCAEGSAHTTGFVRLKQKGRLVLGGSCGCTGAQQHPPASHDCLLWPMLMPQSWRASVGLQTSAMSVLVKDLAGGNSEALQLLQLTAIATAAESSNAHLSLILHPIDGTAQ